MEQKYIFNLPKERKDNDLGYLDWLVAVVNYSNPDSSIRMDLVGEGYNVTITPANAEFRQRLVDNVLELHRRLHLKIVYSKSLKISKKVQFYLERSEK